MVVNKSDKRITGRTSQLCVKLTPELHQELKDVSSNKGILITQIFEEAFALWLLKDKSENS
ncbi:MAG: hypothetical protein AM1032_000005 [Mycoplasmataceae bacterium]|nr:MAG: hypothetical protein AM1032_000005 [Mycoplasmataceae bacterium]